MKRSDFYFSPTAELGVLVAGVVSALGLVALVAGPVLELAGVRPQPVIVVDLDDADAFGTGREDLVVATLTNSATTEVTSAVATGIECFNNSTTNVFRVEAGASSTTGGLGPYCTTCALGPRIAVPLRRLFLRLSSGGPQDVVCSILDGGAVPSPGGGGGASSGGTIDPGTAAEAAYYTSTTALDSTPMLQFPAGAVVVNEASGNVDFRAETDAVADAFVVDADAEEIATKVVTSMRAPYPGLYVGAAGRAGSSRWLDGAGASRASIGWNGASNTTDFNINASASTGAVTLSLGASGLGVAHQVEIRTDNEDARFACYSAASSKACVFNNPQNDYDFVAKTTSNAAMLVVEGSSNCVSIGDATCATTLDVNGTTTSTTVRAGDGSAGSPSYSFTNQTDEGMHVDAATDTLIIDGVSAGGGNVSIQAGSAASIVVPANGSWGLSDADGGAEVSANGATGAVVVNADTSLTVTVPSNKHWAFTTAGLTSPSTTTVAASPTTFSLPSSVSTAPGGMPACSSATPGAMAYVDDTNDAFPAFICICAANAAGTYALRPIDDLTTTCP